jgi:hypothetical protein
VEGYGHLSCCSLFIIQQITDVSADRTAVPAGAFLCENQTGNRPRKKHRNLCHI